MTTSAQRPASPRRSRSGGRRPLRVAVGLGVAVYLLVFVPALALGAWGLGLFARKPAAPVAIVAVAKPAAAVQPPVADAPGSPADDTPPSAAAEEPELIAPPVA